MSKVAIVLTIFSFYACIIVLFGLMGKSDVESHICPANFTDTTLAKTTIFGQDIEIVDDSVCTPPDSYNILTGISFFLQGVGFTISSIPIWANFLLFFPLTMAIIWAVLP